MDGTICFIPIKKISKRVPGKNLKIFCGHPLYRYIIYNAINAGIFEDVYVDTDSEEIKEYSKSIGAKIIDRPKFMTKDNVNGNDLLLYDYNEVKKGELLFQLFATAPLLKSETIKKCVEFLKENKEYDSIFTATEDNGWFWFNNKPVNYDPKVLPRSQDAKHMIKESTGLYGIKKEALLKNKCRIGANPKIHLISWEEALDIDTADEFAYAEMIGNKIGINKIFR